MNTKLKNTLQHNQQTLYFFALEDLLREAQYKLGKSLSDYTTGDAKTHASYYAPLTDSIVVMKILNELGFLGKATVKVVSGKEYVILKGYPGKRNILTGTRYLATNPKIMKMAIGTKAVNRSIIKGSVLSLIITVPFTVVDACLKDQVTMGKLLGTLASDICKILLAAGAASLASLTIGAITTIAAGPLIAAIFIGLAASITLEQLDHRYRITDQLVEALDRELNSLYEKTIGQFIRGVQKIDNILNYQKNNGLPIGQGVFY